MMHLHDSLALISFFQELISNFVSLCIVVNKAVEVSVIEHGLVESVAALMDHLNFIILRKASESCGVVLMGVEHDLGPGSKLLVDFAMDLDGSHVRLVHMSFDCIFSSAFFKYFAIKINEDQIFWLDG